MGQLSLRQNFGVGREAFRDDVIIAWDLVSIYVCISGERVCAYHALESHGFVDAEEQIDVAAGVKRFFQEFCVLLLGGPDSISLCLYDVVEIPRFDHEVSIICHKRDHESACVNGR